MSLKTSLLPPTHTLINTCFIVNQKSNKSSGLIQQTIKFQMKNYTVGMSARRNYYQSLLQCNQRKRHSSLLEIYKFAYIILVSSTILALHSSIILF